MLALSDRDVMATFGATLKATDASAEALLAEMAACLEPRFWESSWFNEIVQDNLQQRTPYTANAYVKAAKQALQPQEHMRFYLRMWRNSISHAEEKQLGLSSHFVKMFPSTLWAFTRSGKVQAATSALRLAQLSTNA
jgi:hypothetical protein